MTDSGSRSQQQVLSAQVDGVSIHRTSILAKLSFDLDAGDLAIVVGPNGAGKTTLLRFLLGRFPDAGSVRVFGEAASSTGNGKDLAKCSGAERASWLGYLPQRTSITEAVRVLDIVVAARFRFSEPHSTSEQFARSALSEADAAHLASRSWPTLSGGEQQRVSLAALLAQDPRVLLFDEPANHLDPAQQIEMYRRIGRLTRAGKTIVCITHDINLVAHAAAESTRVPRVFGLAEGAFQFETSFDSPDLVTGLGALFKISVKRVPHLEPATFVFGSGTTDPVGAATEPSRGRS